MEEQGDGGACVEPEALLQEPLHKFALMVELSRSVFRIEGDSCTGSGFFVKLYDCYGLVTCSHVLGGFDGASDSSAIPLQPGTTFTIFFGHEKDVEKEAEPIKLRIGTDTTSLSICGGRSPALIDASFVELTLKLRQDLHARGRIFLPLVNGMPLLSSCGHRGRSFVPIIVLQFPRGLSLHCSSGRIVEYVEQDKCFAHTASTEPGSSGSPIVDARTGRVLGIHRAAGGEGHNIAVAIDALVGLVYDQIQRSKSAEIYSTTDTVRFVDESFEGDAIGDALEHEQQQQVDANETAVALSNVNVVDATIIGSAIGRRGNSGTSKKANWRCKEQPQPPPRIYRRGNLVAMALRAAMRLIFYGGRDR